MIMIQSKLFQKGVNLMKASESIPNFQPKLREYTNFTIREIKSVCKQTGERFAGSENEKAALNYAKSKLESFSDTVEMKEFSVKPKALAAKEAISGVLLLISAVLSFLGNYLATLTIFSLVIAVFAVVELILHINIFDLFFKKSTSHNVYAKRNSKGETKKSIIISGNMDAPYERAFIRKGNKKLEKIINAYAFIGLAYIFIFNSLVLIFPDKELIGILKYIIILFIPAFIALLFAVNLKRVTGGANNNLTGSFTAIACMKFLSDNNIAFENTEVIALITGAKAAGTVGTKEFFKEYVKNNKAKETMFIELDTLRDIDKFTILSTDEGAEKLLENAVLEAGVDKVLHCKLNVLPTQAKAASEAGVKAAALTAVDFIRGTYYMGEDTAENLEPKAIENSVFIALSAIFQFDEG